MQSKNSLSCNLCFVNQTVESFEKMIRLFKIFLEFCRLKTVPDRVNNEDHIYLFVILKIGHFWSALDSFQMIGLKQRGFIRHSEISRHQMFQTINQVFKQSLQKTFES